MSTEKLAKLLEVDEVSLMHGPKGVALYVRIEKSWQGITIDNEDLGKHRLEVMAEHLVELADTLSKSLGRRNDMRKAYLEEQARPRERLTWGDVGGWKPYDAPQQQVQRVEPSPRPASIPTSSAGPTVSKSLPSRFHAIVDELRNL